MSLPRPPARPDDDAGPSWLTALRVEPRAVLGLIVLGALAVTVALLLAQQARPQPAGRLDAPGTTASSSAAAGSAWATTSAAASPSGASPSGAALVVDVVGRVLRPGLVRVPPGSRVFDVVQAAGGFRRPSDARSVNLARPVTDGEQVVVGRAPAAGSTAAPPGVVATTSAAAVVSLSTATLAELETLPGVGPVLAQRIVEHRTSLGGAFTAVEQLQDVSGIGDATFAEIAPHVRP